MIKNLKIILLGAPGVGKGTISDLMINQLKLKHISTGNLFREVISKDDDLAYEVKKIMNDGLLVPDAITNKIAKQAIETCIQNNVGFILDGYPRTIEQAKYLDSIIDIDYVFYLEAPEKVLLERISGRRICPNCHAIYNVYTDLKPKVENICDNCGSILILRKDDGYDTAKKRIEIYLDQTKPLIDHYTSLKKLVKINALNTIDVIFSDIVKICK